MLPAEFKMLELNIIKKYAIYNKVMDIILLLKYS